MATLIVAHQEYERHFSGILGHFQEYQIFHRYNVVICYKMHLHKQASISRSMVPSTSLPNA